MKGSDAEPTREREGEREIRLGEAVNKWKLGKGDLKDVLDPKSFPEMILQTDQATHFISFCILYRNVFFFFITTSSPFMSSYHHSNYFLV